MNKPCWTREFNHVKKVFPEAEVFRVDAEYEAFHAILGGVRMIFYPHKTSANNYHLRMRNGTPQKRLEFSALAIILDRSKPPSCTFSVKNSWWSFNYDEHERILSKTPQFKKYWDAVINDSGWRAA